MRGADRVVVNSLFTKGVVKRVWGALGDVGVVYPCVDTRESEEKREEAPSTVNGKDLWKRKKVILSINRFERKKDIGLAIRAFAGLLEKEREGVRLVIAGMFPPFSTSIIQEKRSHTNRRSRPPRS